MPRPRPRIALLIAALAYLTAACRLGPGGIAALARLLEGARAGALCEPHSCPCHRDAVASGSCCCTGARVGAPRRSPRAASLDGKAPAAITIVVSGCADGPRHLAPDGPRLPSHVAASSPGAPFPGGDRARARHRAAHPPHCPLDPIEKVPIVS